VITGFNADLCLSSDVLASIKFRPRKSLGLETSRTTGEPLTFLRYRLENFFHHVWPPAPDLAQRVSGHEHWFKVKDADELYALHLERGSKDRAGDR